MNSDQCFPFSNGPFLRTTWLPLLSPSLKPTQSIRQCCLPQMDSKSSLYKGSCSASHSQEAMQMREKMVKPGLQASWVPSFLTVGQNHQATGSKDRSWMRSQPAAAFCVACSKGFLSFSTNETRIKPPATPNLRHK